MRIFRPASQVAVRRYQATALRTFSPFTRWQSICIPCLHRQLSRTYATSGWQPWRAPGVTDQPAASIAASAASVEDPGLALLRARIDESKRAYKRAMKAKEALPKNADFKAKTTASDDALTLSGWKQPRPTGFDGATARRVERLAKKISHKLEPHVVYDQKGFPGSFSACHAEKQVALLSPNHPVGVSKPMCVDCRKFFSKLARSRNVDQVVTDPICTRTFKVDGTVDIETNLL